MNLENTKGKINHCIDLIEDNFAVKDNRVLCNTWIKMIFITLANSPFIELSSTTTLKEQVNELKTLINIDTDFPQHNDIIKSKIDIIRGEVKNLN